MRHLGWAALAAGIATAAFGQPARAATTITIDASKQTAGNPPFWSAAVGTGTASLTLRSDLETHYKLGNREAGFQRVRGHGVLNDDMGIYKGPGSYSWTSFDKYLTAISQAGMRPIMEMDFMPTALALTGNSRDIYKSATDYKNFITAVVQHCVDKFGMADVSQWYWEIWNEPDYAGFWNGSDASEATSAKLTEYYGLYDNAVAAITSIIPNALVGGPATTNAAPITGFLQHCKSAGTRVTFASSHVYPGGASGGTSADAGGLVSDNTSRVSDITGAGYTTSQVMSFNTEWNSSYSGQGGGTGDDLTSMDNNWNVGFILKGVKLLSDKNSGDTPPLAVFSYWVLSDVFDENTGPSGSYILGHNNGQLPFGRVFGLMTAQGVRKAAFNAFKMLNMLGPVRLMSGGGTSSDGVDAMATTSQAGDALQVLVYDTYKTLNTSGSDMVTINISNLPAGLAGKSVFVTQYLVDATHSNPYSVWQGQGSPGSPTEDQWQAMKAAQHLALAQPVSTTALTTSYTTSFTMNRQAGTLLVLSTRRPVTGRDGLTTLEGEDYDGQSGATKEDSNDTDLGQSISVTSGGSIFYDVVDLSDAGVSAVQMRVQAASATTIELHADSASGPLLGKCAVPATGTSWATQSCTLAPIAGVHTLYLLFGGAAHLNWLLFQAASGEGTGTGGASGGAGGSPTGTGGGAGMAGRGGSGAGGSGSGGSNTIGSGGSSSPGTGGNNSPGSGGASSPGTGGNSPGSGGIGTGSGGSAPASGASAGCGCDTSGRAPIANLSLFILAAVLGLLVTACSKNGSGTFQRVTCPAAQVACGQSCVDAQDDPTNCGGCGIPCFAGETCQAGVCVGPADAGAPDGQAAAGTTLLVTSAPGAYWNTAAAATETSTGTPDVTVDATATAQVWEGFGGAFNEIGWNVLSMLSDADRQRAIQLLYGADGARFAFGRIPIGASDYAMDRYSDDEVPPGSTDPTVAAFSIDRDMQKLIPFIRAAQAVNPRIRFWASPWTPPTWMKQGPFSPGDPVTPFDGGTIKTDAATMSAYAAYLVKFVQAYAQQGIAIDALAPQNEPNYTGTYPTCGWSPGPYTTFIGQVLGPAVAAAGLTTKIMLGTFNGGGSDSQIVSSVMGDASARGTIKVLGFQWGMLSQVAGARQFDLPIWQTEHECGNYPWLKPFDAAMAPNDQAYAVESWGRIHDWIQAGVTAYSAWNMVLDTVGVGIDSTRVWPQDALLTVDTASQTLIVTPAYHVFRHVSAFVATGARVIAARGGDALAFRNPDGSLVAVVHNAGAERTMTVAFGTRALQFSMPASGWATIVTPSASAP
jgi:glucosylceramidase